MGLKLHVVLILLVIVLVVIVLGSNSSKCIQHVVVIILLIYFNHRLRLTITMADLVMDFFTQATWTERLDRQ